MDVLNCPALTKHEGLVEFLDIMVSCVNEKILLLDDEGEGLNLYQHVLKFDVLLSLVELLLAVFGTHALEL